MEDGPESEPSTTIRFVSNYGAVFSIDEVTLLDNQCSLVVVAAKYGLIFVGCGTVFKVFESRTVVEDEEKNPLATINIGASISHIACSYDGLTLMVVILHNNVPHALFYEIRNFVPGCGAQMPFVSTALSSLSGARVQGLAWNPLDPSSIAVAVFPSSLSIITLKENAVGIHSKEIQARAVGWSPKGKQLTVGLADGTLALFKPDLTAVRTVSRPPMDDVGSVLSVTWFTNTEFFISYKIESEDGAHVMMYVNAPKAKESRFVIYEYLCNYNQGPRPAMFYSHFFAEWNIMCVLSSRANQLGVLGHPESGGENWCEYEIEEGGRAEVHSVSVTEETFPLGLAVDFTSQKIFINKDETTFGPCPVIFTLSTGGELNMFHVVNARPGAQALSCPLESLPKNGHRTQQQYGGVASYTAPAASAFLNIPKVGISTPSNIPGLTVNVPRMTTEQGALTGGAFPVTSSTSSLFDSSTPEQHAGSVIGPKLTTFPLQTSDNIKPNFSFAKTSGLFDSSTSVTGTTGSTSSFFGTAKPPSSPSKVLSSFSSPASTSASSIPISNAEISSASPFNVERKAEGAKASPTGNSAQQTSANTTGQGLKFPSFQLPQASTVAGSIIQGKPALSPVSCTLINAKTSPVNSDIPKQAETEGNSRFPCPEPAQSLHAGKEMDSCLISTIEAASTQFEEELHDHVNLSVSINEIGKKQEMGNIRRSLFEETEWINQMSSTTTELKGEVSQLHSDVLEGYTLLEEAEAQLSKSKNPRHFLSLQSRPLDPRSRKKLDEIRSLYQYLQSQLGEVDIKLHLDWAAFTNNTNNKKKHELPASETLYQALRKCHTLRMVCEKQVDALCDRLKTLQISFLTFGFAPSRRQHEDDDALANLERILRETTLSPNPHLSPLKMLPPKKQNKLQKVLAQRSTIPLRKCSDIPKLDLASHERLSSSFSQNGSPDLSTVHQLQQSCSSNLENSMSTSFGPRTFSTPNRTSNLSRINDGFETRKLAVAGRNPNISASSKSQISSQFVPLSQLGDNQSSTSITAPKNKFSAVSVSSGNGTSGFALNIPTASSTKLIGPECVAKPQYEDITPPQTPDNKVETEIKAASPLLALSSLVSKVPTTTAVDADPPNSASLSDAKPIFGGTFSVNQAPDVAKSQTDAAVSVTAFAHKPLSVTSSLKTSLPSSVPFSFVPFSPPSTAFSATQEANSSDKAPSLSSSASFLFKLPSTTVQSKSTSIVSVIPEASSANVTSSSLFSFKSTSLSTTTNNTSFTFKSSTLPSSQHSSVTTTNSEESLPRSSSISAMLSKPSNLFGGVISGTVDSDSNSSPVVTTIPFTTPGLLPTSTSGLFPISSVTALTAESDTIANTVVVADNASFSGGSNSAGQETSAPNELEKQVSPFSTLTPVPMVSSSAASSDIPEKNQESDSSSLFGNGTPITSKLFSLPTSSSSSIFGGSSSTSGSLFGGMSVASENIFGITTAAATTITTTIAATISNTTNTTKSSAGSIFGGMTISSSNSIFGNALGTSKGNILGGITSTTPISTGIATSSGSTTASVTSSGDIFSSRATTSSGGIFSSPATTSSLGIFSSPATTSSVGIFSSPASTSSGGIFSSPASTSSGGVFSSPATTSSGGIFSSPATTSSGGIFSSPATTSSGGIFSSPATTSSGGIFSSPATTSSECLFGSPLTLNRGPCTSSTATTGNMFTSSVTAVSSTGSLFAAPVSTVSGRTFGQASAFGAITTSSSGSAFSSLNSSGSGFSGNVTTTLTGDSPFGQTSSQDSSSAFGQNTQNSSGSLFAMPSTTGSVFGNTGQSGSIFGGSTSQGGGLFGGAPAVSSEASLFGQSSINSGSNSGSGGSVFGQGSSASASPFSTTSTTKPDSTPFGTSAGFVAGTDSGGGFFSGLGSKPSEDSANKNVFGSTSFSAIKPQSSLFGGSDTTTSLFGGIVFGGDASSGGSSIFTSATGQPAQSGFNATSPQSSSGFGSGSGFGSPPTFGGAPSFGSPPKFGSPPTFGGTATFGSPLSGNTGGGFSNFASTGASTFGSVASSSPATSTGFGGFTAQTNTASFGGLAQSANQQQQQGSAFGSTGNAFGSGSSFSSWR